MPRSQTVGTPGGPASEGDFSIRKGRKNRGMWLPGGHAEKVTETADFRPGEGYFRGLEDPFGDHTLALAVGPLRMRLEGLDAGQAREIGNRFHAFIDADCACPDVRIALRRAGVGAFLGMPRPGTYEVYRLETRTFGSRLALWSYEFAGCIDNGGNGGDGGDGIGALALVERSGPLFERGLENFLRVVTASWILRRGGFLLHASGVVRDGMAYIFFGPSGAGKTTVTRLSPNDTILSDDLTLIVPGPAGYVAAGIPFGLAHHRVPDTTGSFPIASMHRLVQSRSVRLDPIRGARAVGEVAASLPFVMQETSQASLALDTIGKALAAIPVYRLEFRKDDAFWDVVAPGRN